ncbi:MAG: methyltransferase domain-containing protein [Deltaproteobacteria bacterium]|nr:methyltransferase domain-containing protein [Deltaproteobacteria bacterium]
MTTHDGNRFEEFFADRAYVTLKNLLYNYRLRKRAVHACRRGLKAGRILEVGSGLSPMVTDMQDIVYSELSFLALQSLRHSGLQGFYVVADAMNLPFKPGVFAQAVCSEVLEHLPEDRLAIGELARVIAGGGSLILTFPHRRDYFSCDDRFVGHFRRYDLPEMEKALRETGLTPVEIVKVLGPLEKLTMAIVVRMLTLFRQGARGAKATTGKGWPLLAPVFKWINRLYCLPIWLDCRLMPRCMAAVLLIRSVKIG